MVESGSYTKEEADKQLSLSPIDIVRSLDSDVTIFLYEFSEMPSSTQTSIAQLMKGLAERSDFDGGLIYTCENGNAVVEAEPDLSMRVKSWEI
jgi:hypothetical protein